MKYKPIEKKFYVEIIYIIKYEYPKKVANIRE